MDPDYQNPDSSFLLNPNQSFFLRPKIQIFLAKNAVFFSLDLNEEGRQVPGEASSSRQVREHTSLQNMNYLFRFLETMMLAFSGSVMRILSGSGMQIFSGSGMRTLP
jgi:hypothetical protein